MNVYQAKYYLGKNSTERYYISLVAASKKEDVEPLLNKKHPHDVFELQVTEVIVPISIVSKEQVLTTIFV